VFSGNVLLQGYPKALTELGLPEELDHVDAAAVWGHNSATYIFSGTMYWKYDNKTDRMELDYPRDMSIWKGIGNNIDAAFQWHDGKPWEYLILRFDEKEREPGGGGLAFVSFFSVISSNFSRFSGRRKMYFIYRRHVLHQEPRVLEVRRPADARGT